LNHFAEWLSRTSVSLVIQTHEWVVPAVQSIHIAAIGVVLASVFMIDLRILGWAGRDQTLTETTARFGPWLSGALCVLLVTGAAMVVGEPVRELLAFSFWLKMGLVAIEGIGREEYAAVKEIGLEISLVSSHGFGEGPCNPKYRDHCIEKLTEAIDVAKAVGSMPGV